MNKNCKINSYTPISNRKEKNVQHVAVQKKSQWSFQYVRLQIKHRLFNARQNWKGEAMHHVRMQEFVQIEII